MASVSTKKPTRNLRRFLSNPAGFALAVSAWVVVGFYAAQLGMVALVWILGKVGLDLSKTPLNDTALTTIVTALVYALSLAIILYVPYRLAGRATTRDELGLRQSLPLWRDLGVAPLVYIACFITTAVVIVFLQSYLPGFDAAQRQEIPFDATQYLQRFELLAIFFTLAIAAPVAEELLFRGYLFGKLRKKLPVWSVILVTALVFSALHLGVGSLEKLQWNVAVDTFILALGLGLLRHYTGSVWASMLVHIIKNSIAFFALFILPRLIPAADMMRHLQ
jgi:membrane protease YdiL (CAAX protease family)